MVNTIREWTELPDNGDDQFPLGAATGPNTNLNPAAFNGITYSTLANGMPILNSYPQAGNDLY